MLSDLADSLAHYNKTIQEYEEAKKKYGPYGSLEYEEECVEDAEKHYLNALTAALAEWRPEKKEGETA